MFRKLYLCIIMMPVVFSLWVTFYIFLTWMPVRIRKYLSAIAEEHVSVISRLTNLANAYAVIICSLQTGDLQRLLNTYAAVEKNVSVAPYLIKMATACVASL